jgi:hypothetical protein
MDWQHIVKVTTRLAIKTTWIVSIRIVGLTSIGVLLNWIFVIMMMVWNYQGILLAVTHAEVATTSWLGALVAILLTLLPLIAVMVSYGLVLPYLYFLSVRSYAFTTGLNYLFKENQAHITHVFSYFTGKVIEKLRDSHSDSGIQSTIINFIKKFFTKMAGIPRPVQFLFTSLVGKLPFQATFLSIIQAIELKEDNVELIGNQVATKLTTYIESEVLSANLFYFWILLGSNLVLMLLTTQFLAQFYKI